MFKMAESVFPGIEHCHSISPCADPQILFGILTHAEHVISTDTICFVFVVGKAREVTRRWVKQIQPAAVSAYPNIFLRIFVHAKYVVVAKAILENVMLVVFEFAGVCAYQVNSSVKSSQPNVVFRILINRVDRIITKAGIIDFIILVVLK